MTERRSASPVYRLERSFSNEGGSYYPASKGADLPDLKERIKPTLEGLSTNARDCLIALCRSSTHVGGCGLYPGQLSFATEEALDELVSKGLALSEKKINVGSRKKDFRNKPSYVIKPIAVAMAAEKGWVRL